MIFLRIVVLNLSIVAAALCSGQSTFNIAFVNPYMTGGGGAVNSVNVVGDTIYYHGSIRYTDNSTVAFMLKVDMQGNVCDTIIYDGTTPEQSVNLQIKDKISYREGHFYCNMDEFVPGTTDLSDNMSSWIKTDLDGQIIWKKDINVDTTGYMKNVYRGGASIRTDSSASVISRTLSG